MSGASSNSTSHQPQYGSSAPCELARPPGQGNMTVQDMISATALPSLVRVVDDDPSIREALDQLFRSVNLRVETFGSIAELGAIDEPGCLVLDVRLPGLSGLDFQALASRKGLQLPIIFMTGHGDIPMTVRAMKNGAIDFLAKPFRDQDMLDAVRAALEKDAEQRRATATLCALRDLYATLTRREREVMQHVVAGLMNKQIAALEKVSEITVKIHRGSVMRKMQARSLAELVRQADLLSSGSRAD